MASAYGANHIHLSQGLVYDKDRALRQATRYVTTRTGAEAASFTRLLEVMRVVQGLLSQGIVMDQHELWYRCVSAFTCQTILDMHKAYQPRVTDGMGKSTD